MRSNGPTVGIIRETQAADPARPLNKSTKRQRAMTRLKEDLGEQLTERAVRFAGAPAERPSQMKKRRDRSRRYHVEFLAANSPLAGARTGRARCARRTHQARLRAIFCGIPCACREPGGDCGNASSCVTFPRAVTSALDVLFRRFWGPLDKPRSCLLDWRSIKKPTFRPQRVHAALDLQWRAFTEIAVENLAIIADELDDAIRPFRVESHRFAEVAFKSEQTPDLRVFGCRLFTTFLDVTPNSSAMIIAKLTHFTILNQRSSPCRTTGPSGSLEMISGRTILSSGSASAIRRA